jgi:hypothetical protein
MEPGIKVGASIFAVGALVVGGAIYFSSSDKTGERGCDLSAAGVGLMAQHARTGKQMANLAIGATAGLFAAAACKDALEAWDQDPSTPVPITTEMQDGTVLQETLQLPDLTEEPPPPPEQADVDVATLLACARTYTVEFLRTACYEGNIEPY